MELPVILSLLACFADDYDPSRLIPLGDDTGVGGDPVAASPLTGAWRSEGEDLSDLFAGDPFFYVVVDTTFDGDGTYTVDATDEGGTSYELAGTWSVDGPIVSLSQTSPYEAEAEGLWAVDVDTLTYEVVQTVPDYGYNPPVGDFGTSTGPSLSPGANVQTYRRIE